MGVEIRAFLTESVVARGASARARAVTASLLTGIEGLTTWCRHSKRCSEYYIHGGRPLVAKSLRHVRHRWCKQWGPGGGLLEALLSDVRVMLRLPSLQEAVEAGLQKVQRVSSRVWVLLSLIVG